MRKKLGVCLGALVTLYALHVYINGEVLNALFWMSVASTEILITTSISK